MAEKTQEEIIEELEQLREEVGELDPIRDLTWGRTPDSFEYEGMDYYD